jgi:hypothetical protein
MHGICAVVQRTVSRHGTGRRVQFTATRALGDSFAVPSTTTTMT